MPRVARCEMPGWHASACLGDTDRVRPRSALPVPAVIENRHQLDNHGNDGAQDRRCIARVVGQPEGSDDDGHEPEHY